MENHHFQWVNPLFLWPFSIAMLNYQRVLRTHQHWVPKERVGQDSKEVDGKFRTLREWHFVPYKSINIKHYKAINCGSISPYIALFLGCTYGRYLQKIGIWNGNWRSVLNGFSHSCGKIQKKSVASAVNNKGIHLKEPKLLSGYSQ